MESFIGNYFFMARDVKPTNILVHEGILKLADFGFAKNTKNFSSM